jgi:hypothetical protein
MQVKLPEMELRRSRAFGNYRLGCELWQQLGLEAFWEAHLGEGREEVPWAKVLELLGVSRRVSPGSEFRLHRQGFDQSALGDLLGSSFAGAEKDRLYRCLDRILKHKAALFDHLRQRGQELFQVRFDVLLYDLTSPYIEGEGEEIPKAKHGYSRDHRFDCRQGVMALVVTPEGFSAGLPSDGGQHLGPHHAAPESCGARSPAAPARRGQEGGRAGLRFRAHASALSR